MRRIKTQAVLRQARVRHDKGQAALGRGDRPERDRARGRQPFRLRTVRRQVQIGEQHLAGARAGPFRRLRLLHLDDDLGAGPGLDEDGAAMGDTFPRAGRRQPDPPLRDLDVLWHADAHAGGSSPVP
jgi:hypothetical protein